MSQAEFTEALGEIWEETPEIAQQTWHNRPFEDVAVLYQAMVAIVNSMSETEQITLIKAHPDLGSKTKMAEASVQEQAGIGLDSLSKSEYQRFQFLNQAYKDKFGFPFIVAVKYPNGRDFEISLLNYNIFLSNHKHSLPLAHQPYSNLNIHRFYLHYKIQLNLYSNKQNHHQI